MVGLSVKESNVCCGEIDSWTFGAFMYERILLNIPLMIVFLISIGLSTRYKVKLG